MFHLHIDLGDVYTDVFTLWKYIKLYPYNLHTFLYVCIIQLKVYTKKKQGTLGEK